MDEIGRGANVVAEEVASLADAFGAITAEGTPAALVIRRGSTVLLDIGSGTDRAGTSFTTSTPVLLCSVIKPAVALAALLAVADGALDLDDLVAAHWPAFGANGKEAVTVRHVLAHAAGVPGWREPFGSSELADPLGAA
jgi:CubicO group peptidase (beta-lactamase class C family)